MEALVVHDDREASDPWGWVHLIQQPQEVAEQPLVLARPKAVYQPPCRELEGASHIRLGMLAWGHDELPGAFGDPGLADFRAEREIEFIYTHHHDRRSHGIKTGVRTGAASVLPSSAVQPRVRAREARTMR
jgi:hypothetical protein